MSGSNAVESLLIRLQIPEAIPKLKAMHVDRIVSLRMLSEAELCEAVPDPEKRQTLLEAINSRGNLQARRSGPPAGQPAPPHPPDADFMRSGFDDRRGGSNSRGRGGGRGGGRGRGAPREPIAPGGDDSVHICRHHFGPDGCKYGDKCRYSHDESLREMANDQQENIPQRPVEITASHCEECIIPSDRIKYLLGAHGNRLRSINEKCNTLNERFDHVDEANETFTLKVYGNSREDVLRAKELVLNAVGLKKEKEQKHRFQYAANELESNTQAAQLLCACNTKNKGTPQELSDAILKSIISSFRFVKPQVVRHFFVNTNNTDKDKLEIVTKLVAQLRGVQAILFCDQKRVEEMSKGSYRISRYFNGVDPQFVYRKLTKEQRLQTLEKFKKGVENEEGVRQRLLVTSEDYAKLARKTVIPYVNLVIHFSVPRTEEFYLLQSLVSGRQGTVGASLLCVTNFDETIFRELEKSIEFEKFTSDASFTSTAMELVYDTRANPLTPEDADPPADWQEHLNDAKPKSTFGRRH